MELLELAAKLGEIALEQRERDQHTLDKVGAVIEKRAKEKIGEYQEEAGPFIAPHRRHARQHRAPGFRG